MIEIDPQDVVRTTVGFARYSLLIKNNSQVIGSEDYKSNEKKQKECNVAECNADSNQDTNGGRYVLVSKEYTRAESYCRDKNRKAFHLVQAVEFRTIRATHRVKVKGKREEEHSKNLLQIGPQRVRENDDHCQNGLPKHNNRLPEHKVLLVGTVQKATGFIDPPTLVVLLDVSNNDTGSDQGKPKGENDEKRPTQHES